MKSLVLLSGGMDSATVLSEAQKTGECVAVVFMYGQRHIEEVACARQVAKRAGVDLVEAKLDFSAFSEASALTSTNLQLVKNRSVEEIAEGGIPNSYVPARNTIFLSNALAIAELHKCNAIWIGVCADDQQGYPDCRPNFIDAARVLCKWATARPIELFTPLLNLNKKQIIRLGTRNGVDYLITSSCYDATADGACGQCDSCVVRRNGFRLARLKDATRYRSGVK